MELEVELTRKDWADFNKYVQKARLKESRGTLGGFPSNLVIWIVLVAVFVILFNTVREWHWPTAIFLLVVFVCAFLLFIWNIYRMQALLMPAENGIFVGRHRFVFDETGIHTAGDGYTGFHRWEKVRSLEQGDGMIIIFFDTVYGFVFPETQMENPAEFVEHLKRFRKQAPSSGDPDR